jgi:hypothetical protein
MKKQIKFEFVKRRDSGFTFPDLLPEKIDNPLRRLYLAYKAKIVDERTLLLFTQTRACGKADNQMGADSLKKFLTTITSDYQKVWMD